VYTVNVFVRVNSVHHGVFVDVIWQRQLHQETSNPIVRVQFGDHFKQLILGHVRRQFPCFRVDPDFYRRLLFPTHICRRSRIFPHQHYGQSRPAITCRNPLLNLSGDLVTDLLRQGLPVDAFSADDDPPEDFAKD
jgi:hypothetical protein